MTLRGKTALVTGGGRGIGRAIVLALAAEGAAVAATARTRSEIEQTAAAARAAGGNAVPLEADLRDPKAIAALAPAVLEAFGRIDILVNNAGLGHFGRVAELGQAELDEMWEVNVRAAFLLTRAALPSMTSQGSGDIVNIASLAGRNAFIGGAGYSATKWALIGFARTLMLEVREHNIRVITLCPGSVDTAFAGPGRSRPRRGVIPTAEDVAAAVVGALRMPRNVMVSEIDIRPTNPKG